LSQGLHEVLDVNMRNQIFNEYLDEDRLHVDDATLTETLRKKYKGTKFDLVVGAGRPALTFLLPHGEELWPGTPLIFIFVDYRLLPARLPPNTTAIALTADSATTLDLALRLMPNTRRVFYVGGTSPSDKARRAIAEQDFKRFAGGIEFTYLTDLSLADLLDRLGKLPDGSLVVYGSMEEDVTGHVYIAARVCRLIASASNAPVYSSYDTFVGSGIVGGRILDFKDLGTQTARLALRVMDRGTASGLPIETWQSHDVVDWRQLQRWQIPESRVPKNAVVLFRERGTWERYRWYIFGAITIVLLQSLLIAALVVQARRRKEAESAVGWTQKELEELSGRLIHAQEEERKRVARELHDNFGQRLTVLAMELAHHLAASQMPTQVSDCLRDVSSKLKEVSRAMNMTAHQLHSSDLEVLGLVSALQGLCNEFSRQYAIQVSFVYSAMPTGVPAETTLCLFRVVQEALQNVAKHSGALSCEVTLGGSSEGIHLSIKDPGIGFDTTRLKLKPGLGFVSMRERLRLVGGEVTVESKPSEGTRLDVRVPIATELRRAVGQ
jgi:signal transduction histidine kinase